MVNAYEKINLKRGNNREKRLPICLFVSTVKAERKYMRRSRSAQLLLHIDVLKGLIWIWYKIIFAYIFVYNVFVCFRKLLLVLIPLIHSTDPTMNLLEGCIKLNLYATGQFVIIMYNIMIYAYYQSFDYDQTLWTVHQYC